VVGDGVEKLLLASEAGVEIGEGNVSLPPDSVAILRRNCPGPERQSPGPAD